MKIIAWGSRGSIAVSGPEFLRYGGNTTCLEIRTASGKLVVVDAGSGLRLLGKQLLREKELSEIRFYFTHSHWDHLAGFPFFVPAYLPKYTLVLCDGPHAEGTIQKFLAHQMEAPYFPVDFSVCKARFVFQCEHATKTSPCAGCQWYELAVHPVPLNHPNGGYGFKFTEQGRSFVFLTDNELGMTHPGGLTRKEYAAFCRGADLLFHDAQYTDEEYQRTRGWGHSTYQDAVDLAIDAGVRRLGLFHHDPDRTDDDLDRQLAWCRERIRAAGSTVECFAVSEGMTLEV